MTKPVFKTTSKRAEDFTLTVKQGKYVFREGDLGTEMYIIHEGKVEILQSAGGDQKRLALFEKGDFFGEMSLLEELPRSASARAVEDAKLLRINSATFTQMLRDNPEIAVRMMRKLSRRLWETDQMLRDAIDEAGGAQLDVVDIAAPPPAPKVEKGPERLVHDKSDMEFRLAKETETTIGRRDPVTGIYPDIDLTPVDVQRSISRRHAKIYRREGRYFLSEEIGTMNGTFVNGARLETGVPAEVRENDEVRLGMVVTTFLLS